MQDVIVGQRFQLGRKIGAGSFGDIHLGTNLETNEEVAVKLEAVTAKTPQLIYEAKLYTLIGGAAGIPNIHWYGNEGKHNVMVLDLLGPSLEDYFEFCSYKFSLRTILRLAEQVITCIENVHAKNYLHRDIKPDNFVMGLGKMSNQVHIIDFGLAKRYQDPETKEHIPCAEGKNLTGTAEYSSLNTHLGFEQSRRDDLESIGFMLFYFLRGELPWQGMDDLQSAEKHKRIMKKKVANPIEDLGKSFPSEFATYFNYCRSLDFVDRPDYMYPRMILKEICFREGLDVEVPFDWHLIYENKKVENEARYGNKAEKTEEDELALSIRQRKSTALENESKERR